jgi:quercetin dioxygenase-like cupin family protein
MDTRLYGLGKNEGQAVWFLNTLTVVKATAKETNGAFGLVEEVAAAGFASPYHVHHAEDETFYLIEGELEFISGGRRLAGGPGFFVFLPRDVPHGFRVVGTSPARFLIFAAPAGFEGFVIEMGEPASSLTLPAPTAPDMERLIAVAAKYQIEILGPLPQ